MSDTTTHHADCIVRHVQGVVLSFPRETVRGYDIAEAVAIAISDGLDDLPAATRRSALAGIGERLIYSAELLRQTFEENGDE